MLTEDHKRQRVKAARESLDCYAEGDEELLDSIVTDDETGVYYTTLETKKQSRQLRHSGSPKPRKFKQTLSAGKVISTVFWDRKGILLCEFIPTKTIINDDRYCQALKNLCRAIKR